MRIAKVIGTVTLNRSLPGYRGAKLKLVLPLQLEDILGDTEQTDDTLVAWDELGAGIGNLVALSEGPEAAQPFRPEIKPIEAYAAAILDRLDVDRSLAEPLVRR
jgi:microcompartment protein CcmK/EutM